MRVVFRIALTTLIGLLYAVPAYASDGAGLPDPNGLTLLSLGLVGLVVGQRAASKGRRDP